MHSTTNAWVHQHLDLRSRPPNYSTKSVLAEIETQPYPSGFHKYIQAPCLNLMRISSASMSMNPWHQYPRQHDAPQIWEAVSKFIHDWLNN